MDVLVALEQRFERTPDGALWTPDAFAYRFWLRYLEVFERVRILARIREVADVSPKHTRADGPSVEPVAVPYYVGPWQYLKRLWQVRKAVRAAAQHSSAMILRVPGRVGSELCQAVTGQRPYGIEVLGDPYDMFAPGNVRTPLRPFLRIWSRRELRRLSTGACAAAYVTARALQRHYPCPEFSISVSDVELAALTCPRAPEAFRKPRLELITVGSLAQLYKAPDVAIDALAECLRRDVPVRYTWIGDGAFRPELEARVRSAGMAEHFTFAGQVPHDEIAKYLQRADLFVLASRQEGLPRALIEAMAQGLPCIGSTIGGIPELLDADCLVPPGDALALAQKVSDLVADPVRLARLSVRNVSKASEFTEERLRLRRLDFYRTVKARTLEWQNRSARP